MSIKITKAKNRKAWIELTLGNQNKVVNTTVIKITCTLLLFPHTLSFCGCESRKLCHSALNLRVHLIPQRKAFYVDWRLSSMAKKKAKRGISSPPTWGFMTQTLRLQSWCLRVVGHSFISTSFTTARWLKINCFNWIYMFNLYGLIELHYLHVFVLMLWRCGNNKRV